MRYLKCNERLDKLVKIGVDIEELDEVTLDIEKLFLIARYDDGVREYVNSGNTKESSYSVMQNILRMEKIFRKNFNAPIHTEQHLIWHASDKVYSFYLPSRYYLSKKLPIFSEFREFEKVPITSDFFAEKTALYLRDMGLSTVSDILSVFKGYGIEYFKSHRHITKNAYMHFLEDLKKIGALRFDGEKYSY